MECQRVFIICQPRMSNTQISNQSWSVKKKKRFLFLDLVEFVKLLKIDRKLYCYVLNQKPFCGNRITNHGWHRKAELQYVHIVKTKMGIAAWFVCINLPCSRFRGRVGGERCRPFCKRWSQRTGRKASRQIEKKAATTRGWYGLNLDQYLR